MKRWLCQLSHFLSNSSPLYQPAWKCGRVPLLWTTCETIASSLEIGNSFFSRSETAALVASSFLDSFSLFAPSHAFAAIVSLLSSYSSISDLFSSGVASALGCFCWLCEDRSMETLRRGPFHSNTEGQKNQLVSFL